MNDKTIETELAVLQTQIGQVQKDITEIKELVKEQYVLKSEFDPVRKIVYGLVSVILVGVIGALMTLVIKQQ